MHSSPNQALSNEFIYFDFTLQFNDQLMKWTIQNETLFDIHDFIVFTSAALASVRKPVWTINSQMPAWCHKPHVTQNII